MTPRSPAIRNFCYLPFCPTYFGTVMLQLADTP